MKLSEHSSSKYSPRTYHNAKSSDLTVAIAVDFSTAGEKLTHKAAGHNYLALNFNEDWIVNARKLYKELKKRQVKILNVAGNGIYTFGKHGHRQKEINRYLYQIISKVHEFYKIEKIISGGQSGMDIAAIVVAEKLGIDCEATFPKGFIMRFQNGKDEEFTEEQIKHYIENMLEELNEE
jgi:hypothetical protein